METNKTVDVTLSNSLDNAVYNLSDKTSESVGDTLNSLWYLAFGWIEHNANKRQIKYQHELEELRLEVQEGLSKIPPEKQVEEPNLQKVAAAIQNVQFCVEEKELRTMFKNLIINSLNKDTVEQIHPSFADKIKSMSPRDASNLASFGNVSNAPIVEYRSKFGSDQFAIINPYVFLRNPAYTDTRNQAASISMLETLGLVKIDFSAWLNDSSYEDFYKTEEYLAHKEMTEMANKMNLDQGDIPPEFRHSFQHQSVEVRKGIISLTPIGSMLKQLCE